MSKKETVNVAVETSAILRIIESNMEKACLDLARHGITEDILYDAVKEASLEYVQTEDFQKKLKKAIKSEFDSNLRECVSDYLADSAFDKVVEPLILKILKQRLKDDDGTV